MKKILVISSLSLVLGGGLYISASTPTVPSFEKIRKAHQSSDLILTDREGRLLHQWRKDNQKRAFAWVELKNISPAVVPALLKSEDRNFFRHSGVDLRAMAASFYQRAFKSSLRGASTLSMQVVKLSKPDRKWQGILGKVRQSLAAWELERHWTKEEILESYLNLAPFRGEYRGLSATSWALFNKPASGLTQKEATLLAVLLRAPNATEKNWTQRACWQEPSLCSEFPGLIANSMSRLGAFPQEGQKALHLAQRLSQSHVAGSLQTSINLDLQTFIQQTVEGQISLLKDQNVHDAAVLVIENETGEVWAYVGGSGPMASAQYVDGIQAQRQAGSTLKPFLYATAFEKNILKPNSWLEDSAVDIVFDRGVYKPQNHDHLFYGWVQAKTALASSLNVPAVKVFKLLNDNSFWEKLQLLHFKSLNDPDFYGPALALGVADINLEDLTQAYRTLARGGLWSSMKFNKGAQQSSERIFTAEASEAITSILSSKENRALGFGMDSTLSLTSDAAVKTGTSKDMRDNWCVGYNSRFTVGVWVGNFNGQPMWNVMGITGAGPIWNQVMSWLQEKYPSPGFNLHLVEEKKEKHPKPYPKVRILYPQDGMILAVDPAIPLANQKMPLLVEGEQKKKFSWRINGKTLVSAKEPYLWTPTPGRHTFELLSGNASTQKVQVIVK
ncbi:penicillin-binding protein 1C [Bdellovibrio svalbardensis]|uniref:peptidoglycan glycosyltransferase n=1 Tax=Bdellovibrio svalbardensis TaxID=2972972 RepID=A0ABT6DK54_9BACT|nr:penicillin-binding protein 1C [Bdellovibrio svalbardensis]MDG0817255.1 penicillin-binding protein 1C [Bdellovibrio svalbardensis]